MDSGEGRGGGIPFPYEPYPQQSALMGAIYDAISSRKSGCFESPTGTGKSLSLICAAMYWQQQEETRIIEHRQQEVDALASSAARKPAADDDWLADIMQSDSTAGQSAAALLKKGELERHQAMKARVAVANSKDDMSATSSSSSSSFSFNKHRQAAADKGVEAEASKGEDDEFVLPMYDSDDGAAGGVSKGGRKKKNKGLETVGDDEDDDPLDEVEDETDLPLPKLFYCSRTHTQIAQFVSEIRRTAYSNARVVTLGSRKLMCLHPEVSRMQSDARMSDACLDMQKSKGKAAPLPAPSGKPGEQSKKAKTVRQSAACTLHTRRLEEKFADRALGQLRDIEELVALGRELKACPYYSVRRAVRYAQVVCMPYNVLLHAELRASMGVSLEGAVVVFDEAHNLVDAVNHTHSAELSLAQLDTAARAVSTYLSRFQFLLGGRNVYYLNLLGAVVRKLRQCLLDVEAKRVKEADAPGTGAGTGAGAGDAEGKAHTVLLSTNDFLFRAALDNINLFKLKRHIAETNLVARIGGYSENQTRKAAAAAAAATVAALSSASASSSSASAKKAASQCASCQPGKENAAQAVAGGVDETWTASQHALRSLLSLLVCLTNNDADGRVALLSTHPTAPTAAAGPGPAAPSASPALSMRFILLNPSVHFSKIVSQARSVILLGGTLRPFSFISSSLFAGTDPAALSLFSCGHVVAQSSITAIALGMGPRGGALEFTHATRLSRSTTDELHGVLLSACQAVPHGFVAFFTSYAYMEAVVGAWRASGQLSALQRLKAVFVEPRAASESEAVWAQYCAACVAPAGALLLCVMGGKLSEGINFSDHLARCVAVVGMPYPDSRDPILQEKLRHCDALEANSGKKVYEAMCMKSVNQSIGRSIRHVRDYAAILLLDRRYAQPRVIAQLPSWIERSVHVAASSAEARAGLDKFFAAKAEH